MPLAIVTRDPALISDKVARRLGPIIQTAVADALDVVDDQNARLNPNEVEVRFRDIGPLDVNASPFSVDVFANDYPGRRKNLQQRTEMIAQALKVDAELFEGSLPLSVFGNTCFVWIILGPAGFVLL